MTTKHKIINEDAQNMHFIQDKSIGLVVTSPPYPMIEMWDTIFSSQNLQIAQSLQNGDFNLAFSEMHNILNHVWREVDRVLIDGGFVCINIGDATRNCNGNFKLFSNHSRIISFFHDMNYSVLPDIIWRKQTNAPNKFMGSGMLPAGAYVTFEHEYVLIFRKNAKREFKTDNDKLLRQTSAYFWEERNKWFSDLWDLKGSTQNIKQINSRSRSAAFPFELAYRLINMYSVKGDTILDPFSGTGTTMAAAMCSERNSVNVEIDKSYCQYMAESCCNISDNLNSIIKERIKNHLIFTQEEISRGKEMKYYNKSHGFNVKTKQEINLCLEGIEKISREDDEITVSYQPIPNFL